MKLHITELALNQVTVPEGKKYVLVHDSEQAGFAVLKTKHGSMSYVIVYRNLFNKQKQEKVASVGDISAASARALVKARLDAIQAQKGRLARGRGSMSPTMDDYFFATFLPAVQNESRSHLTHASIYRNHIQSFFGKRRLDEISGQDVIAFHTHLRGKIVAGGRWKTQADQRLSDGTVKRILILVRHIFNVAIRDVSLTLKTNPTHALKLTTVRNVKGRFLTQTQLAALLEAAAESDNKDLADIIRVMGATGLRRENVLAMEWSWFDETRGTLTVPTESDKAKRGFVLHLSSGVLALLRLRQERALGRWVFPNAKTGKPYYSCRCAWVTACEKANLHGLRMHDMRHSFASFMLESGADIIDVQHALAHTQIKTTAVYLHLTENRKRAYADAAAHASGIFA